MATARTINEWSPIVTKQSKFSIWKTTLVINDNGESDIFTKRTPNGLDMDKPFDILVQTSQTADAQALPVKLWGGFSDDFALAGDTTTVAATNGALIKQLLDDCVLSVTNPILFHCDPDSPVADVVTIAAVATGLKVRIPKLPYYILHFDGGSTLAASTTYTIWLVQKKV